MGEELMEILDENIIYLATSTTEGKPNVVPIGLAHAISDEELLIVDVLFNKTRKNLEENPEVAISFTDMKRLQSYQLKGRAEIFKSGEIYEKTLDITAIPVAPINAYGRRVDYSYFRKHLRTMLRHKKDNSK